jgi:peptidoglycan/xylan/chitin deacetylase (PgdA/CDA1 family)
LILVSILGCVVFIAIPAAVVLWVACGVAQEYRRDRIPILLYHRLLSRSAAVQGLVPDDEMVWVSYDTVFAQQMEYLRHAGYTTLDFDDYVRIRGGEQPLPTRAVLVTLDDGYESAYTMAFPVLKSLGMKATVFVAPEPDEHTRQLVAGVDGFLNPAQMREMADNGISIQSHTLTHCILSEMDDAAVTHELLESRRRISDITGRPVEHLAVPRAGYSRRVRRRVAEAGYKTACCNNKGTSNGRSDPLALPRIVIERDMSVEDFARCLTPRSSAMLRIVGNIKRIPEYVGGVGFAQAVRGLLYRGPLRPLFETRALKRMVAVFALLYLGGSVWFIWRLVTG